MEATLGWAARLGETVATAHDATPVAPTPVSSGAADLGVIQAVRSGDSSRFEELVRKYQPRIFATARRYARRESEVEDIVQEVFLKAFQKLDSFRADAPFEHWLMRLAVRTCYDFLRLHQRNRETSFSEMSGEETDWIAGAIQDPSSVSDTAEGARQLVERLFEQLSPSARLVLTLLEIEDRPVKEVALLTGWSVPVVKVRAFRARAEMKKLLARLDQSKFL